MFLICAQNLSGVALVTSRISQFHTVLALVGQRLWGTGSAIGKMTQRYLEIYLFFEKDNFKNGEYDYPNIYWKLEEKKLKFFVCVISMGNQMVMSEIRE